MLDNILNRGVVVQDNDCRISQRGTSGRRFRYVLVLLLLSLTSVTPGAVGIYAQYTPKVPDGIYYIKNNNSGNWYLWPSVTVNGTTGFQYLTTSNATEVGQVNQNGVQYGPFDNSYSHWVVKNIPAAEAIQLINPKLNKYVVIRHKDFGDRDVWLADVEDADDITYTYMVLNNNSSPYKVSPYPGLNDVNNTSNYSLNSAQGTDRAWLTWSEGGNNKPRTGEGRAGLIQFYSSGTPLWSFIEDLLPAPTIHYDETYGKFSFSYSGIPSGYDILYTTNGDDPTVGGTGVSTFDGQDVEVTQACTVKAVVARYGVVLTNIAQMNVVPSALIPDQPTVTYSGDCNNLITISTASEYATIYYTIDDSDPVKGASGTFQYTEPFVLNQSATIKAAAFYGINRSEITPFSFTLQYSPAPVVTVNENSVTISGTGTVYYTTDGTEPNTESSVYSSAIPAPEGGGNVNVKAVAIVSGLEPSCVVTTIVNRNYNISSVEDLNNLGSHSGDYCVLLTDFDDVSGFNAVINGFGGILDGNYHKITGLERALFNSLDGGTVKNLILDDVNIQSGENVGAICNEATGNSRIYNCGVLSTNGSSISGSGNVGGLVGLLDGSSRVINCYSFANITGGNKVGGIVGRNNYATTATDIRTMVMNCMFYGDITGGTSKAPVYNGETITNVGVDGDTPLGLNNYNYFRFESTFTGGIDEYNCALGAEERYLLRFEFYRYLLNSNRELAAFYATGNATLGKGEDNIMGKWVLDKSIAPYPVLKPQGTYHSIINYDADNQDIYLNKTLTVNISLGSNYPSGAGIRSGKGSVTLKRTGKDPENYNFNYDKVQLPYYNEVGTGNYTHNRVVTGWKITAMSKTGTSTEFSTTDYDAPNYNFADRDCIDKDIFSVSGRVFAQGAYFAVPNGVTSINIEPCWAECVYLSDPYYDVTYNEAKDSWSPRDVTETGVRFEDGQLYIINGHKQKVYTQISSALGGLSTGTASSTVYERAIVLVGNYHSYLNTASLVNTSNKPLTIMSADLDFDNEPDYSMIYQHTQRRPISPVRFDFLNWPGVGMAHKVNGSLRMPDVAIFQPNGWFEITNTCVVHFYQFEYDYSGKKLAPLILLGGIYEQFVSTADNKNNNDDNPDYTDNTKYIHVGGNAWFKMFNNGTHGDRLHPTPHRPISVTGGDFDEFYLSGMFNPDASLPAGEGDKNAECYIDGGRFGEVAGAGMEQIDGNVTWIIDHADITSFYGGGINAAKEITGSIDVTIRNSKIDDYCGGPKFGDMHSGMTVSTDATNCTFNNFFGAGYGGTSLNKVRTQNVYDKTDYTFSSWATSFSRDFSSENKGIAISYEYEYMPRSGFGSDANVGRFYINYASFSLATTGDVTSTLTDCEIMENFYGGGRYGMVDGDIESTLEGCTVGGSVFGAGFSASVPSVEVMKTTGFKTVPSYNRQAGVFIEGVYPDTETYTWVESDVTVNSTETAINTSDHKLFTNVDLDDLGMVTGKVTLNINDGTTITGSVYGGGESSDASGDVEVNVVGGTMTDVFGGGKGQTTVVGGDVTVNIGMEPSGSVTTYIGDATLTGSVYGGSALGAVNARKVGGVPEYSGTVSDPVSTYVNVFKGTVEGSVFGGGLGQRKGVSINGGPVTTEHIAAVVFGDATVTVGATAGEAEPEIKGSVFGGSNANGISERDVYVNIIRGNITGTTEMVGENTVLVDGNVHGGGMGQFTLVKGNVEVNIGCRTGTEGSYKSQGYAVIEGNVYGGSALGNVNARKAADFTYELPTYEYSGSTDEIKTNVTLHGGTVKGYVFGGGLGQRLDTDNSLPEIASDVYGPVTVKLNPYLYETAEGNKNCIVQGGIFGSNDQLGTPKKSVTVHIYRTQGWTGHDVSEGKADDTKPKTGEKYELAAVYGGGNLADYNPVPDETAKTEVVIEGCDETSIEYVYGGGNAASVPATDVTVNSCYEIGWLFGGGNGHDALPDGSENPGANVGYHAYTIPDGATTEVIAAKKAAALYGAGKTRVTLFGGTIHKTFGGSNTKGNVREAAEVYLDVAGPECLLQADEVFGAGNEALMDGTSKIDMGCVDYLDEIYGGANDADLYNDVVLNIQSGTYGRVFGGNNKGGTIHGTITVNIEETGCKPVVIGQLYGGGNEAPYTVPEGEEGPTVNIKSFTSIGEVYGGGLGEGAVITGDVHININEAIITSDLFEEGYKYKDANHSSKNYSGNNDFLLPDGTKVAVPARTVESSGGSAIPAMGVIGTVYGGGNSAKVDGDTYVKIGTLSKVPMQTILVDDDSDPSTDDVPKEVDVAGANITGNVFGGGNNADVTGDTHIKIGPDPE